MNSGPVLSAGRPWPLGAHWDGHGINFALFSAHAKRVELCLFDGTTLRCADLPERTNQIWHGYLEGAVPGLCYAYRVAGPTGPGHRFAPERLLLDPYARALTRRDAPAGETYAVCIVDEAFDWGDDAPPLTPLADSVLYEVHVKGASRRHPDVPEALRGTYAGLATPPMIAHFKSLGVTALNLLPVHLFLDEERLAAHGRVNYWGYNTLAFFAPEPRYASGHGGRSAIAEFRTMVRDLHANGIEVILDVVFNHTAESDENGPLLSFRGIDNASYYRLPADAPERYENFSGCGNTLNLAHPRVLQLVMDALRYWVGEMHVDGFRFDLAAALTRDSGFLAAVAQDPLLARVKLIAEPWDLGPDGYRLGRFPVGWSEWNDRFRDDIRRFWLDGSAGIGALAQRLAGSSEIFRPSGRMPDASINFITAHDGFTLRDLVSYNEKHNDINGEQNRDGHAHNFSWNCGEEGDSAQPEVIECRRRLQRALLATLLLAQGTPMLQGGDEAGRTQAGNNNAYCQDNALTWIDWENADRSLIELTGTLIGLRRRFPQLRRRNWLTGESDAQGRPDVCWWHPDGHVMREDDWHGTGEGALGVLGVLLAPPAHSDGQSLLILFNRNPGAIRFALPQGRWHRLCDTAAETSAVVQLPPPATQASVAGRSVHILAEAP